MPANYWMSPETTSLGRLPILNIEHFEKLSLDGTWRFQLIAKPSAPIRKRWMKISVPSLWTHLPIDLGLQDGQISSGSETPFDLIAPQIPEENPTGVYERDFEIPGSWQSKRIVLNLGGTESVAQVTVNGVLVGVAKDSRLGSDFDITSTIRGGKNTVRIEVAKWSDSTYLENIHGTWSSGLSRSVKLYATHDVYIERLYTRTDFAPSTATGYIEIEATIGSTNGKSPLGYTLRASIEELPKKKGSRFEAAVSDAHLPINLATSLLKVSPWSDENPVLYTLNLELVDPQGVIVEISSQRIGFRSISQKNGSLNINGKAITLRGVNPEEHTVIFNPVATRDEIRQELLEIKRGHFNAIFTSHFANDPSVLDLCDELGIYAIAQANIFTGSSHHLADDARYLNAYVDRASRMVQRDIHHPSVILWSLGSCGHSGVNCETASTYIDLMDPSRPIHECDSSTMAFAPATSPLEIKYIKNSGQFEASNNQVFNDVTDFDLLWKISRDGEDIDFGKIALKAIPAGKSLKFSVKSSARKKGSAKSKNFVTFSVVRKTGTAWASPQSEIARFSYELKK
jgi:beta-galactosidase